jgi:8-oxo-dGTP pyrophosphatase MutT (NUDIX family)
LGVRSVNILVRDLQGRTLLQFRDGAAPAFPLTWGFWGGALAPDHESPADGAARELAEELALPAASADFTRVGVRQSTQGDAWLMLYRPTVRWGMFEVREGAAAGFFWRREILRLPMTKALAEHLRTDPHLFAEGPTPRIADRASL